MRFSHACLLLLGLLACLAATLFQLNDPNTVELTDANFNEFVAADLSLVAFNAFNAPWCARCISLEPEYAVAATQLKALGVPIGKLDAAVHSTGAQAIPHWPHLKVFRNGKPTDYTGPRKAEWIVAHMKKLRGPPVRLITTHDELQELLVQEPAESPRFVLVAFFNAANAHAEAQRTQTQLQNSFNTVAERMRDEFLFAQTTDPALRAKYGVAEGTEALVAFLQGSAVAVYEASSSSLGSELSSIDRDLEAFVRNNSLPLVGEYSEVISALYEVRGLPLAKLFINVTRDSRTNSDRLSQLARRFAGRILVAYTERSSPEAQRQLERLNMQQQEENAFVIENIVTGELYKYGAEDGLDDEDEEGEAASTKPGLDVEGFEQFISNFLAGNVAIYMRSQNAPKNNMDLPVKIATARNLDKLMNDDTKDVMIVFYAPWSGHCKVLLPKLDQLAQKLQDEGLEHEGIVIAKFDSINNDYDRDRWDVRGHPTVFFKPAGPGEEATLYEGQRLVDDMYAFLKEKAHTLKSKGGGGGGEAEEAAEERADKEL